MQYVALLTLVSHLVFSSAWSPALHRQHQSSLLWNARNDEIDSNESLFANSKSKNITAVVMKKIRVAQIQSEIDRILQGPDAPIDMDRERLKVTSSYIDTTTPEVSKEQDQQEFLENDLYDAVQQQDFARASRNSAQLAKGRLDDFGAVLQVNARFYKAFSHKSLEIMNELWLHDASCTCVHPSCPPLVGYKNIYHSWKKLFEKAQACNKYWLEPQNLRLTIQGTSTAIVTCDEHVHVRRFVRGHKRHTEQVNTLTASNVFRKLKDKWYMVHHHASWHSDSDATKLVLNGGKRILPRSSDPDEEAADRCMDGIMGSRNFGLLFEDSKAAPDDKPKKKVIMGSLSDFLNGNLGDMLSGNQNDKGEGARDGIIQFRRIDLGDVEDTDEEEDDEEEDEDEDDMYEPDDEDDDDDDDVAAVVVQHVKRIAGGNKKKSTLSKNLISGTPKDMLRQQCIGALRKLSDQGTISPEQKRLLLTDIISSSAKGECSMVEVAYELLCGEIDDDEETAEEEFADQCRVLATSLRNESLKN
jgi:hypothetical protein